MITPDSAAIAGFLVDQFTGLDAGCLSINAFDGDGYDTGIHRRVDVSYPNWIEAATAITTEIARTRDVYIGVNPIDPRTPVGGRGTIKNIASITALVAEIDVGKPGSPPTTDDALSLVRSLPLPPNKIMKSGGDHDDSGLHLYFFLKEPFVIESDNDREFAIEIASGWGEVLRIAAQRHGWKIDSVFDLTRVLRPTGTLNHKARHKRTSDDPPRLVTEILGSENRYNLDDFEPFIPESAYATAAPPPTEGQRELTPEEMDAIAVAILPAWIDSQRHPMALAVAGWLASKGIAEASTMALVERCSLAAGDRQPKKKREAVTATYIKLRAGGRLRGWADLRVLLDASQRAELDWALVSTRPAASKDDVDNVHSIGVTPQLSTISATTADGLICITPEQLARYQALETENVQLRAENRDLRSTISLDAQIRRNQKLGTAKPLAMALPNVLASLAEHNEPDKDGLYTCPLGLLADVGGVSNGTASKQARAIAVKGGIQFTSKPVVRHRDGERPTVEREVRIGLPEGCDNLIDFRARLAQLDLQRNHGGTREPKTTCPNPSCQADLNAPGAPGTITTTTVECGSCHELLAEPEQLRRFTDREGKKRTVPVVDGEIEIVKFHVDRSVDAAWEKVRERWNPIVNAQLDRIKNESTTYPDVETLNAQVDRSQTGPPQQPLFGPPDAARSPDSPPSPTMDYWAAEVG